MLRYMRNNSAQVISSEYVLIFFVVMGMMGAMTIYFKRALQARVYDARNTMINYVGTEAEGSYSGKIWSGYEPYYTHTESTVLRSSQDEVQHYPVGWGGAVLKQMDEKVSLQSVSNVLPPKEAARDLYYEN